MLRPLSECISRMRDAGVFREVEAELAAFQFVAMASGEIRVLMIPRDGLDRNRDFWLKATVDLFLDGTMANAADKCAPVKSGVLKRRIRPGAEK